MRSKQRQTAPRGRVSLWPVAIGTLFGNVRSSGKAHRRLSRREQSIFHLCACSGRPGRVSQLRSLGFPAFLPATPSFLSRLRSLPPEMSSPSAAKDLAENVHAKRRDRPPVLQSTWSKPSSHSETRREEQVLVEALQQVSVVLLLAPALSVHPRPTTILAALLYI